LAEDRDVVQEDGNLYLFSEKSVKNNFSAYLLRKK
jgi:hypothetical protein